MTVETTANKITGLGNGSATVFPFTPLVLYAATDIRVTHVDADGVETELTEGTGASNYSLSVAVYPGTGSVTYPADQVTPIPSGEKVVITTEIPQTQTVNLTRKGGYDPEQLEIALDRMVRMIQQLQEIVDRSIKMPVGSDVAATEVAEPEANQVLTTNSDGTGVVFGTATTFDAVVTSFMESVLDDPDAATALATLGINSFLHTALAAANYAAFLDALDSAEDVAFQTGVNPYNLLINAEGGIDQENEGGVYTCNAAGGTYVMDGYRVWQNTGTLLVSRDTTIVPDGASHSIKLDSNYTGASPAAGDFSIIEQSIEGRECLWMELGTTAAGTKYVRVGGSVYASRTGTFSVALRNSAYDRCITQKVEVSAADDWQDWSLTFLLDDSGTWLNGPQAVGLRVLLSFNSGTDFQATANNTWETGAKWRHPDETAFFQSTSDYVYLSKLRMFRGQRDFGYTPTPEWMDRLRCERRYRKSYRVGSAVGTAETVGSNMTRANGTSTGIVDLQRNFPPMFATPALTWYSPDSGAADTVHNDGAGSNPTVSSETNVSDKSTGYPNISVAPSDNQAIFAHWVADARI